MKSVAQSKKFFYDWLDKNRPWASTDNCYDMMEAIVAAAARFFTDENEPTKEQVEKLEAWLDRFTHDLPEHPDDYDGPCQCLECRTTE